MLSGRMLFTVEILLYDIGEGGAHYEVISLLIFFIHLALTFWFCESW